MKFKFKFYIFPKKQHVLKTYLRIIVIVKKNRNISPKPQLNSISFNPND